VHDSDYDDILEESEEVLAIACALRAWPLPHVLDMQWQEKCDYTYGRCISLNEDCFYYYS